MKEFIAKFSSHLLGVLSGFDRVLIRGSLRAICYPKGMMGYLSATSILLKDFGRHVQALTTARTFRLAAYDAAYLEVARRERLPLATLDGALRTAAAHAGVELVR